VDVEHGTHLTINGDCNAYSDRSSYHTHETSHAREGVYLLNEQINRGSSVVQETGLMITDPYRPAVGKTAPKDPPFVVKRSGELPAGHEKIGSRNTRNKR
jgi:hypothetical protein